MAARVEAITKRPTVRHSGWRALSAHYKNVREVHLRQLFADDPKRGPRMTVEALGLLLDYSKNRITAETLKLLLNLAEESRLRERIDAMFRGEKINITEKRPVLHTALRPEPGRYCGSVASRKCDCILVARPDSQRTSAGSESVEVCRPCV